MEKPVNLDSETTIELLENLDKIEENSNENELTNSQLKIPNPNKRKTLKKPWKPRKGMTTKNVSLDKVHKKLMTILGREIDHLMVLSNKCKLEKEDSLALCNYLKLHKQLVQIEEDLSVNITDEELERIANNSKTKT